MPPFRTLTSRVAPLPRNDVDTDQIIPARYLKVIDRAGLAQGLFSGWRFLPDGSPDPHFPLNRPEAQGAQFLLAGDNFGCGSSREHAPWALTGWGFRAVISTSFADIFRNNAMKNGLLPAAVDAAALRRLFELVEGDPSSEITIDLAAQEVRLPDGYTASFPIDAFNKTCLLEGLDQLGYLLRYEAQISAYETRQEAAR
ncbi:MAG: 3-isopropylmalate dehydratase small subunit [Chloroflexota bacterium]